MGGGRTDVRPGDWNCPTCGVNVYSTRLQCFRCHTPKPAQPPALPSGVNVRPGDWTCPNCQVNVYASREKCFRCDMPKPASWAGAGMPSSVPLGHGGASGMWLGGPGGGGGGMGGAMGGGGFGSFGGFGGGMGGFGGHSSSIGGGPRGQARPGDWTCPECSANVFASRDKCFRCSTARPGSE